MGWHSVYLQLLALIIAYLRRSFYHPEVVVADGHAVCGGPRNFHYCVVVVYPVRVALVPHTILLFGLRLDNRQFLGLIQNVLRERRARVDIVRRGRIRFTLLIHF